MSRKHQIITITVMFSVLILAWCGWYIYSLPGRYTAENIDEVQVNIHALWTEEGPMLKKISQEEDIKKFVQLFNSFKIRPYIYVPEIWTGWELSINIKQNKFPGDIQLLVYAGHIEANGKKYILNKGAKEELEELFLQDDFGEQVPREYEKSL